MIDTFFENPFHRTKSMFAALQCILIPLEAVKGLFFFFAHFRMVASIKSKKCVFTNFQNFMLRTAYLLLFIFKWPLAVSKEWECVKKPFFIIQLQQFFKKIYLFIRYMDSAF